VRVPSPMSVQWRQGMTARLNPCVAGARLRRAVSGSTDA
jgi:hypothetical protein